jgi:sortase A
MRVASGRQGWSKVAGQAARRLANDVLEKLSTLLLVFGAALLLLGAAVQLSRSARIRSAEIARPEPAFATSPRRIAPAISSGPSEAERAAGRPVRIVIESIGLDSPVVNVGWDARIVNGEFEGNVWQTADYAAGYHETSAPAGFVGNTVISGHNNLKGAVFKDLYKVEIGDRVRLYDVAGRVHDYDVVESFVTREEGASESERRDNTQWIRQSPDERVTLVSCFPPWSNTHRIIVVAFPVAKDFADLALPPAASVDLAR